MKPSSEEPAVVIAIDGTSASGKSTNAKLVAKALGFVYVDTGAMYRTLAWYCLRHKVDVHDEKAVGATCRKWQTSLENTSGYVHLKVSGYYPEKEIRTAEVSAAVPHVAAMPKVRDWMKKKQRKCIQFGSLVMEGRDIGTNVFPETDFKYYLDAQLEERARRRAPDGIHEDLAAVDQRDSRRAAAPLMIALGAKVINNSKMTSEQSSGLIIADIRNRLPIRTALDETTRLVYSLGFAAKEHIAMAEKLLCEPPRERFDRLILPNKVQNRHNHLTILRKLAKRVRLLDAHADELYFAWQAEREENKRKRLHVALRRASGRLQEAFPGFCYNRSIVEGMVLVAGNIREKLLAARRAIAEAERQAGSPSRRALLAHERKRIRQLEQLARMPSDEYLVLCEQLRTVQEGATARPTQGNPTGSRSNANTKRAQEAEASARNSLLQYDYSVAGRQLALAVKNDPFSEQRLRAEFGFLWAALDEDGKLRDDTSENAGRLRWETQIWTLLSDRNQIPLTSAVHKVEATKKETPPIPPSIKSAPGTAESKGEALERAVEQLFGTFFRQSKEIPWKIRQQKRGSQSGYDVGIEWSGNCEALNDQRARCHIECKNYSDLITLKEVGEKLLSEPQNPPVIDHWILISPRANPSNELNRFLEEQRKERRFPFDVQVWCPETGLADFFGLEPDLYDQFYKPAPNEPHPRTWEKGRRDEIIGRWRTRLRPTLRLPKGWFEYMHDPAKLCSPPENAAQFSATYDSHVPMRCRNSAGALLEKPLSAYVDEWLEQPNKPVLFLLGEFGDGKTCFTYTLARDLMAACLRTPQSGWLPLRLTLRKYPGNARDFVRQRLEEFNADVGGWLEMAKQFRRLVILDGFDEMSVKLDPATVTENIQHLLACAKEFEGCKILITSRTHFFENRQDATRLMSRLHDPAILHLSPIGRHQVTSHLLGAVSGEEARTILARVREMSDPIGLASKPLFLEMLKDVLVSSNLPKDLGVIDLYEHYIDKALSRKSELLDDPELRTTPAATIENLRNILGDLAEQLQRSGQSFISLKEYQAETSKPLAELLWQLSGTPQAEEDARSRLGARSLLVRVPQGEGHDGWAVDFCHRSMREYFVGLRLCRAVEAGASQGAEFLRTVPLNHEILQFAVEHWRKSKSSTIQLRLLDIIRGASVKNQPVRSGGYALTLLFRVDAWLPRDFDWTGKMFDYADLEEADLSGMNFHNCSFRHASFANAVLENTNFEDCDLTGVRIEETKPVIAVAAAPSGVDLLALYGDGILRKWNVQGVKAKTKVIASLAPEPGSALGFHETGQMWLSTGHTWQFLNPNDPKSEGYIPVKAPYECAWNGGDLMTLAEQNGSRGFRVLLISLEKRAVLCSREVKHTRWCAALGEDALVWSDSEVGFRVVSPYSESAEKEASLPSPEPTCLGVWRHSPKTYLLAGGAGDGTVRVWQLDLSKEPWTQQMVLETNAHEGPVTSVAFLNNTCLASGGADRAIVLTHFNDNMHLKGRRERRLQLTLRCRGMKIRGLTGAGEAKLLASLIAASQ